MCHRQVRDFASDAAVAPVPTRSGQLGKAYPAPGSVGMDSPAPSGYTWALGIVPK
jgi:hypothetical protein